MPSMRTTGPATARPRPIRPAAHAGLVQAERAVGEGGGARASRFLPLQVRPEGRREPCLCPISRFPRQAVADLGQGRLHVLVADDALVLEAAEHAAAAVHARALHLFHHGLALVQPLVEERVVVLGVEAVFLGVALQVLARGVLMLFEIGFRSAAGGPRHWTRPPPRRRIRTAIVRWRPAPPRRRRSSPAPTRPSGRLPSCASHVLRVGPAGGKTRAGCHESCDIIATDARSGSDAPVLSRFSLFMFFAGAASARGMGCRRAKRRPRAGTMMEGVRRPRLNALPHLFFLQIFQPEIFP